MEPTEVIFAVRRRGLAPHERIPAFSTQLSQRKRGSKMSVKNAIAKRVQPATVALFWRVR